MTRLGYQIPNFTYPDTGPADLFGMIAGQAIEADGAGFDAPTDGIRTAPSP